MTFLENELGFYYEGDGHFVFFGKTTATLEKIKTAYPRIDFQRLKQTHSDICLRASRSVKEADAHWSDEPNCGLLIATADCIPLMIYCNQTNRVAAIHAGWRGVANQITVKTLKFLTESGSTKKDFKFYFGPHILQSSFEISEDVFSQLVPAQYNLKPNSYIVQKNHQYNVDLQKIVISQIENFIQSAPIAIESINLDTKQDLRFFSYRRGKQAVDRNLSFIVSL